MLDEVEQLLLRAPIALGDGHDQAQVGADHRVALLAIASARLGELRPHPWERRGRQAGTSAQRLQAGDERVAVGRVAGGIELRSAARDGLGGRGERGQDAEQEVAAYRQWLEQPADGASDFPGERAWHLRASTAARPVHAMECSE